MDESLEQSIKRQLNGVQSRFCMPGHKGKLDTIDVTETGEIDNLMYPKGALKRAHERCAEAYGAKAAHFCVNGSTSGVLAMLCSLPLEGKTILLGADCHISVASGLIHSGAIPRMLNPQHREDGIPLPTDAKDVATALMANPSIAAVFITSPNYYGFCADVPAIAALCHQRGIPLLVDAAHGAHFGFAQGLPTQPVDADAWVVSAHKTLNVPNQGAVLFLGKDSLIEERRLWDALATFQTSSPSWPLLCALDSACTDLRNGQTRYPALFRRIERFSIALATLPIDVIDGAPLQKDATRLILRVKNKRISGFDAATYLHAHGIWVEMADPRHLVLITAPVDTDADFDRLLDVLSDMPNGSGSIAYPAQPMHGELQVSPRCATYGTMLPCALKDAAGRVSARAVCCYPPGVCITLPGQRITEQQIDYLLQMQSAGATLIHVEDGHVLVLP